MKGDIADAALWQSMAHNDGYAKGLVDGRKQGLEEAAEMAAVYSPHEGYDDDTAGRAAMKAGDEIAAAIRALKEKA